MTYPRLILGAAIVASLSGCFYPRRATLRELQHRAVFDLGCPSQELQLHSISSRTRAVAGCGRRLVYVEHCDPALDDDTACGWVLDTPTFVQAQWPQSHEAEMARARQLEASRPPSWPGEPQVAATANAPPDVEPPVEGEVGPATAPPEPAPVKPRRAIPTELYEGGRTPVGKRPRPVPTDLFDKPPVTPPKDFGF